MQKRADPAALTSDDRLLSETECPRLRQELKQDGPDGVLAELEAQAELLEVTRLRPTAPKRVAERAADILD